MDGILIVNKPIGYTSNDIVNKVKHIFNCKVGHTGTLDPNATGVLPLLLGNGTKFSKYLINHDKKYCATIKLGEKSSTGDSEGTIIETKEVADFDEAYIQDIMQKFLGKQIQTPPIYSAIKVNGKKLYEYARQGKEVEIPKRSIEIYQIELIKYNKSEKTISFNVECSKGTYIRSLCEDIAEKLNTVGYMKSLDRLRAGEFCIDDAVSIDDIKDNANNEVWIKENVITLEELLKKYPAIDLSEENIKQFYNGVKIPVDVPDGLYRAQINGLFIGSGVVQAKRLKRDVITNMDLDNTVC